MVDFNHRRGFATRAVNPPQAEVEIPSRPISPPIYQASAFAFDHLEDLAAAVQDPEHAFVYSRYSNPTVDAFERALADLEGADASVAFASGMAAIHAAVLTLCSGGDHIIVPNAMYGGTTALFRDVLWRLGISATFVPNGDLAAIREAMGPTTKLVYAETIANPTLHVADIQALAKVAHENNALLVMDSTFATPYLCRPIEHGADVVIHSASKYLGGHGDLVGGVVAGKSDLMQRVRRTSIDVGGAMSPFIAWLLLRGLSTLELRMLRHSESAKRVAEHLVRHPRVSKVIYPGIPSHPQYDLASRLLPLGQSGIVSFELVADREEVSGILDNLQLILRAGSLGDAHSLIIHPASVTHRQLDAAELLAAGISDSFVRLSVGLEDKEDIIADLDRALAG